MEVTDNPQRQQFELRLDGQVAAIAQYRLQGDTIYFTHTEVQPGHEGQGLGSKIAKGALDNVKGRNLQVVAQCEFIAGYIAKHPEYGALLVK
ncbi:GNAT family N-acetyltransferase [Ramlibacter albus]|uniref:N-acetyltransferase n=1 Tax=Ramlibacter albus TaxID=2079448 RepID=A0A923S2N7_9BURK|nr:GNAT family N-acetyltransferase [Ramlibacter albus]MBC5764963.1 N-acetyltransferase [Ramlibacter albus]